MTTGAAETPVQPALIAKQSGQNPRSAATEAASVTAVRDNAHEEPMDVMSAVLERPNMQRAYARVLRNKGAPGVDGMMVGELKDYLKTHWSTHKQELLEGTYKPKPVRKVEIPKPGGGKRQLGIPTVLDRFIQQALHQVLSPVFEPGFSESSYGFRPGRNAGQAVQQARDYVEAGHRWVVDIDLEAFFDRVSHDMLMARVARRVKDKRVLKLIRAYLESGVCEGGLVTASREGTPQGGPLSPLLSNILLTDLDRELTSMARFLETQLKLRVNQEKSAVDRPWKRVFLGYTVCHRKYNVRLRVASKSVQRLKAKLKMLFRSGKGRSIRTTIATLTPKLRGWVNYFRYAGAKGIFEELDGWIRRHLRKILWRQWKRPSTRAKTLMRLGLSEVRACTSASNGRGPWWNSGASHLNQALPKRLFDRLGLVSLMNLYHRLKCLA